MICVRPSTGAWRRTRARRGLIIAFFGLVLIGAFTLILLGIR